MRRPLVYIAAPYTTPDPVENTHNAIHVATDIVREGLAWPVVPHLTMFWHAITPMPYETWLQIDLAIMARCDIVLRLPGESSGADAEVAEAIRLEIPVVYSVRELRRRVA